jgi:hypothetical protein
MWPHPLRKWLTPNKPRSIGHRRRRGRLIPRLELLEDRLVPAGINV